MKPGPIKDVKYIAAPLDQVNELPDVDVVYHLAASIDYKASLDEMRKRNVEPTRRLLHLCSNCKHFIFMSTTSVYEESPSAISESTPTAPYSNYGRSKLECEEIIKSSSIPYTIIRSSQVFGPDFEEGYSSFLKHLQKGDLRLIGDGSNFIPLVHINDLIDALLFVRLNKNALNQVFNLDGDYRKTQLQFMGLAARLLGVEPPAGHMKLGTAKILASLTGKAPRIEEYADKLAKNRQISIEKIKAIGFRPRVELEPAISEVIKSFRKRGMLR